MKKSEPKRRTPLKSSKKPIRREGPSTLRWKKWRALNRKLALERAGNRCEYHIMTEVPSFGRLEWNHCFGRNDEPWSSWEPFTTFLCLRAHHMFHAQSIIRRSLQKQAIKRFFQTSIGRQLDIDFGDIEDDPQAVFNAIIRRMKILGVSPDADSFRISEEEAE